MVRRKGYFEFKQFTVCQLHAAQKVGTDSDLLGALGQGGRRILDIGTGTGVLSLMMAQRYPAATITAVEIDDNAIIDAQQNFSESKFCDRITLVHSSFQDFPKPPGTFDAIICNPPYFDKSLEPENEGRLRARHTSSLPFPILIGGAYDLLTDGGTFSVCIPPEVLTDFHAECIIKGFHLQDSWNIKSVPDKPAKRYILIYKKASSTEKIGATQNHEACMRNTDRTYSNWYHELMQDFLL